MSDPTTTPTDTPVRPYGVEGKTLAVCKDTDGVFHELQCDTWIDGLMSAADPASIKQLDAATEELDVRNLNYQVLYSDHLGLQEYTDLTAVRRIKLSELPDHKVLQIRVYDVALIMLDGTKMNTRWDNIMQGVPILDEEILPIGAPIGWSLRGWTRMSNSAINNEPGYYLMEVYRVQGRSSTIPRIMTANWGEIALTYEDMGLFIRVLNDYPESFEPGDAEILGWAMSCNCKFNALQEKNDITSTYDKEYMYWLVTPKGNWIEYYCWVYGDIPMNLFESPPLLQSARKIKDKNPEDFKDINDVYKKKASDKADNETPSFLLGRNDITGRGDKKE